MNQPEQEDHLKNMATSTLFGALIGGGLGFGTCVFILDSPLLFPGDTILAGAVSCGIAGFFYGEPFIEWIRENWWWFW